MICFWLQRDVLAGWWVSGRVFNHVGRAHRAAGENLWRLLENGVGAKRASHSHDDKVSDESEDKKKKESVEFYLVSEKEVLIEWRASTFQAAVEDVWFPWTLNWVTVLCACACMRVYRTEEGGRKKCGQYWPLQEGGQEVYGHIAVVNQRVDNHSHYNQIILELHNTEVTHTHTHAGGGKKPCRTFISFVPWISGVLKGEWR